MNLHKLLKELRISAGYTQQNIADLLGLERSAYTYYETGKAIPPIDKLVILSRLYEISVDRMLGNPFDEDSSRTVKLSSPELTKEEEAELEKFRTLSRDEQQLILSYRAFSKKQEFLDLIKEHIANNETED